MCYIKIIGQTKGKGEGVHMKKLSRINPINKLGLENNKDTSANNMKTTLSYNYFLKKQNQPLLPHNYESVVSPSKNFKRIYSLTNNKGMTLLGTLMASVIGVIAITAMGSALIGFTEQTKKITHKRDLAEVKTNIINILRDSKVWEASLIKAKADNLGSDAPAFSENCFPGAKYDKDSDSEKNCEIKLWHNPLRPSDPDDYNDTAKGLKLIVRSFKNEEGLVTKGVAFFQISGRPIYLTEDKYEENDPESVVRAEFPNRYVRVDLFPPEDSPSDSEIMPSFKILLVDTARTKTIQEISLQHYPPSSETPSDKKIAGFECASIRVYENGGTYLKSITIQKIGETNATTISGRNNLRDLYSFEDIGTYIAKTDDYSLPNSDHKVFGAICNVENAWIVTGCTHKANGDNDDTMYRNGCFADVGDGSGSKNAVDARCCRMKF